MLDLYETKRREAIHQFGPMATCDHGRPLSEGCTACHLAGAPVIDND